MPTVNRAKLWNYLDEDQYNETNQKKRNGFEDISEKYKTSNENGYKEEFKKNIKKLVNVIEKISNNPAVKNDIEDDISDITDHISSDTSDAHNIFNGKSTTENNVNIFKINSNNDNKINNARYITNGKRRTKNNERLLKANKRYGKEDNNVNRTDNDRKQQENLIKKPRWRLDSRMLVTLVILNVTGQGTAVEVISTNTLASLLGYPSTCTLGSEVRPCTLSLTCWLRGGTRLRGCGGWLFSCCQQPDNSWDSFDNNVPSSDWNYKVSPPRLRQVPQRNVMPNNVFRRRVDEDVTPQFDCGVPSSRILQKRIIGGREARFAEFPWQAHVRISEFQCGGVLVSRWYVATAAHCVSRAHIRDIVVWLGALDTSAGSHTARKVGVIQKILHPLFQFRMTQPDRYDIALLKLSRPITFTHYIRAICLPESELELWGRSAVIAGWGKTDATDTHTGTNMLRSATVPILSKEQCITWHRSKQISVEIHSEMICAGHSDGHQDACLGDSGGPLIVLDNGRYYLVGITSAGFGCGVDHQPGIYHNVQITANWIRGVMSPTINYIEV